MRGMLASRWKAIILRYAHWFSAQPSRTMIRNRRVNIRLLSASAHGLELLNRNRSPRRMKQHDRALFTPPGDAEFGEIAGASKRHSARREKRADGSWFCDM